MRPQYDINKVRSLLVPIPVNAGAAVAEFALGTQQQLRDAAGVISIEALPASLMPKGPSGEVNAPDAFYKNCVISVANNANTIIRTELPLATLIRSNGNSSIEKINLFSPRGEKGIIDPEKTKIKCGDTSTLGGGTVVLLNIVYLEV